MLMMSIIDGLRVAGISCANGVDGVNDYGINGVTEADDIVNVHDDDYDVNYDIDECE